jgi:predicted subunit of tRNA(5-methylaminomethyl-2-thiouridylate) methyltransferase
MAVAALFSAGKDSALAVLLLEPFYDVVPCHCTFGVEVGAASDGTDTARLPGAVAARAADALGLRFAAVELDRAVADAAVERMVADGYPREGIQRVHEHALETVASRDRFAGRDVTAVADGTRRDDRVPAVDRSVARSLEDRHGIDYVRPLAGYGRGAVDELVARRLRVETGPSERLPTADYETELRALMAQEHGQAAVDDVFPEHTQSRVVGRRD